ncbi:MAG: M48 family metalloprotease [Alphaproteobacteria bacterium]|nr:M48 family metalloprotease [Alphaproteobacteria bacterium]
MQDIDFTQKDILSALERGELPKAFMDEYKLMDPADPRAKAFASYMNKIMDRLVKGALAENYRGGKIPEVRFMLIEDESPNAWMMSVAKPPIVAFTSGLFKILQNESELAGILCHELGHDTFYNHLGLNKNGKLQELAADLRAPYLLRKANYPQSALRTALNRLEKSNHADAIERILHTATAVHPNTQVRLSMLKDVERMMVRGSTERGWGMGEQSPQSIQDNPFPSEIRRLGSIATKKGVVEKSLEDRGFSRAAWQTQLDLLEEIYTKHIENLDPFYTSRLEDYLKAIGQFRQKHEVRFSEEKTRTLIDKTCFSKNAKNSEQIYRAWAGATQSMFSPIAPVGNQARIQKIIDNFRAANSELDATTAAKQLVSLYGHYYKNNPYLITNIDFTGFDIHYNQRDVLARGGSIVAPWKQHAEWAVKTENPALIEALKILGVASINSKIAALAKRNNIETTPNTRAAIRTDIYVGYEYLRLLFDGDGTIKAINLKDPQSMVLRDKQNQSIEEDYVDTVDWSEMNSNFKGFCQKHIDYILGKPSYSDRAYPFAERFVDELEKHIAFGKHKSDYEWFIKEFWQEIDSHTSAVLKSEYKGKLDGKLGFSATHPVYQHFLESFSSSGKERVSLHFLRYYSSDQSKAALERWEFPYRVFAFPQVSTIQGLLEELAKESITLSPQVTTSGLSGDREFILNAVFCETITTLQNAGALNLEEIHKLRHVLSSGITWGSLRVQKELFAELKQQLDSKIIEWKKSQPTPDNLNELITNFKLLQSGSSPVTTGENNRYIDGKLPSILAEHSDIAITYQKAIRKSITELSSAAEQKTHLEKLIFKDDLPAGLSAQINYMKPAYSGDIDDPKFKDWVTKAYVLATANYLKDLDPTARAGALEELIKSLKQKAPAVRTAVIMEMLLKTEAANIYKPTEEEASLLREHINDSTLEKANSLHLHFAGTEVSVLEASKNPDVRAKVLELLTSPYDIRNAKEFLQAIKKNVFEYRDDLRTLFDTTVSQEGQLYGIELLHKTFWNTQFEVRSLIMNKILFPVEQENDSAIMSQGINYAIDSALPPEEATRNQEVSAARKVVQSYFEATDDLADRRFMAAAILTANPPETREKGTEISPAKGLSLVLGAIDPAGDKVKQAIESHPDTPQSIKEAFKDSKTMAKNPPRDIVIKWVKESNQDLPKSQQIRQLSRILGAGSYGITVQGFREDGSKVARTILYPNVRPKAENEFKILSRAVDILVKKDPRFEPVLDMVRQAQRSSSVETDMDIAAKQAHLAANLYDGMKITVGEEAFTFQAAPYIGHGADHKDFLVMPGKHFNDIWTSAKKSNEPKEIERAKAMAKALLTVEILSLLRGGPFDHDRHGGQQRISGNHIGQFDFGGMSLAEMTEHEKKLLGKVFGKVIGGFTPGKSIATLIYESAKSVATSKEDRDFLAAIQRGILALGNFQEPLDQMDMLSVLAAVVGSGQVDATIRQSIEAQLDDNGKMMLSMLEMQASTCGITIEKTQEKFQATDVTDEEDVGDLSNLDYIEEEYVSGIREEAEASEVKIENKRKKIKYGDESREPSGNKISNAAKIAAGIAAATAATAGAIALADSNSQSEDINTRAARGMRSHAKSNTSSDPTLKNIAGITLSTVGAAALLDGIGFAGKGLSSLTKAFSKNKLQDAIHVKPNKGGMFNVSTAIGIVTVGLSALLLMQKDSSDQNQTR